MGSFKSKIKQNIVFVGLDNSGKSTVINYLKPQRKRQLDIAPTMVFQVEQFKYDGIQLTVFDMSGQGRYRNLWEYYYKETTGIVFVIDSADTLRLCVARDELRNLLSYGEMSLSNIPILFFANKMDLPNSQTAPEIAEQLELHTLDNPHQIIASNALTGSGITEGMNWLIEHVKIYDKTHKRIK